MRFFKIQPTSSISHEFYVQQLGSFVLKQLRFEIREEVAILSDRLSQRLASKKFITANDHLACVIIATKVLDDESDYSNSFFAEKAGLACEELIDKICFDVLDLLDWRVSPF
tara:strand:- start:879 stop:1214 length:336 start_codon:yes stop_codon:yes gene_type:complete